ncbi:MAG TPA: protealysin inhibitor emfourin [Tepidisphaeraceae bacterium]|nr:protealysin inhibitor emfourin [Tepidisphaeraceae bacterium]
MRITLRRTGGFANINPPPMVVDTSTLPRDKADALHQLVEQAKQVSTTTGQPSRGTDRFQYELTVDDQGKQHQLRFAEGADPALSGVVRQIQSLAKTG